MTSGSAQISTAALMMLALAVVTSVMAASMTNVALPDIREDFAVGADTLSWVVTAYVLTFATGTIIYGRLADMLGIRPLVILGFLLFAIGSLAVAVSPGFGLVVAMRAVQGFGGTAITALSLATIVRTTAPEKRGTRMGAIILAVGVGFGIGPLIGGTLTELFSWRAPFFLTGATILALLIPVLRIVPMPAGTGWARFDFVGAIAITGALAGFILAVNQLPRDPASTLGWSGLLLSIPLWIIVIRQQTRFPAPFMDNRLLADRRFIALSVVGLATQGAHFALVFLVPLLLQDLHDLPIIDIGLVLLPGAIAIGILGITGGWLGQRLGMLPVVIGGEVVSLAAAIVLHVVGVGGAPWLIGLLYAWFAAGYGAANATVISAATEALPDELAGLGTGVFNLFFFMGGAISVAIAGAIVRSREGTQAWNPLFQGDGDAYSDALIVVVAFVALGLVIALATARGRTARATTPSPATRTQTAPRTPRPRRS